MFNDHQDIINTVEATCEDIFYYGKDVAEDHNKFMEYRSAMCSLCDKVQQRLEYMQSQIDTLMLEHCPDGMSKEQLDNWAKNQKVVINDEYIDKMLTK